MNKVLFAVYAVFGLATGCFIGMGNGAGIAGAVLPGLIIGALLAIPSIHERSWNLAGVLVACALVGSLAATAFPDNSPVKRFCHDQTNLVVHVGSYQLGTSSQIK
jgi:ABC-type uncharacterized transport system permease subunit